EIKLKYLYDFLNPVDFFHQGAFDTSFERNRRARAAAASPHQPELDHAIFDFNKLYVATVPLKERTQFIQRFNYFVVHLFIGASRHLKSSPYYLYYITKLSKVIRGVIMIHLVEFCASNMHHGTDDGLRRLECMPDLETIEYGCLGSSGQC